MKLATRVTSCIIIAAVFLSVAESRRRCPVLHAASGSQKTGCYIIVLKEATSAEDFQAVLTQVVKVADSAKVYGMVQRIAKAFTVKLTSYALHSVRNLILYSSCKSCIALTYLNYTLSHFISTICFNWYVEYVSLQ